ncbi:nucleotidyl transferase AbiEii/AbiGii toxin family protein [Aeromonas rivipollensis]|uniref:nucleotidyl transferase AbiEii/AbiGii toxin family protein n=1 Tax=Aeromonas rivipollensis TaxID=948519 RepID=UPI000FBC5115
MTEHEALIFAIANALGDELLQKIAFVGGATVSLHLDDAQPIDIRSTKDVDFIVSVSNYCSYQNLADELRQKGFKESLPEDGVNSPICRYVCDGILVDVMPDDEKVLGFSNPWFHVGLTEAIPYTLPMGKKIRIVQAKHLLATKLVAYASRGGDMLMSKDAEDIVVLINGRDTLVDEIASAPLDLRQYIRAEMSKFISNTDFLYLLSSAMNGEESERIEIVEERFRRISSEEILH